MVHQAEYAAIIRKITFFISVSLSRKLFAERNFPGGKLHPARVKETKVIGGNVSLRKDEPTVECPAK